MLSTQVLPHLSPIPFPLWLILSSFRFYTVVLSHKYLGFWLQGFNILEMWTNSGVNTPGLSNGIQPPTSILASLLRQRCFLGSCLAWVILVVSLQFPAETHPSIETALLSHTPSFRRGKSQKRGKEALFFRSFGFFELGVLTITLGETGPLCQDHSWESLWVTSVNMHTWEGVSRRNCICNIVPFNILPERMTFGYPIHFHQQLHFSVRNANGKSVLSLTVLWRKQASNYDSDEFL